MFCLWVSPNRNAVCEHGQVMNNFSQEALDSNLNQNVMSGNQGVEVRTKETEASLLRGSLGKSCGRKRRIRSEIGSHEKGLPLS